MNAFTPSLPAPLTTAGIAVAPSGRVAALSAGRSEAWTAAINHRFVNELFSGELDDAQLSYYIIQDNQFFVPFLELLGEALVRADTVEAKLVFGRQLGMICSEESGWFEATFDELGVSQADRAHPHLSEPTRSFENLMHKAVNTHHYPTVCWCCWWWLKVSTLTGPLAPMPRSPELIFLINSWDGWICTEAMSSVPGCNSWLMNSNALRDR